MLKQKFLSNPFKNRFSPQTRLLRPLVRQHKPLRVLVRSKELSNPPPRTFVNGQGSSPLFQSFSTLLKPQMPQPTTRRTRSGQVGIHTDRRALLWSSGFCWRWGLLLLVGLWRTTTRSSEGWRGTWRSWLRTRCTMSRLTGAVCWLEARTFSSGLLGQSLFATFSGLVQAPEQTAAEGERVAVYVLAAALLLHGRRLRLLVDNQAVAGDFAADDLLARVETRGGCGELSPRPRPVWRRFGFLRMRNSLCGWCSEAACRRLNSLADAAVSHELAPYRAAVAACEKDASVRRAWSAAAVASQTAATQEYHDKFVELVRSLPPRPSGRGRRASA